MTIGEKSEGPLSAAARAFELELERYERITTELQRTEVSSDETLSRSKALLDESSNGERRLGELLVTLLQAMNGARDRQQTSMDRALDAARRMQVRANELSALLVRFVTLGERARAVTEPVAAIAASRAGAVEHLPALDDLRAQIEAITGEAHAIAVAAAEGNWPDLARESSALRDQVQASGNELLRARRNVAEHAAS